MSLMVSELYDALKQAGATEEKARSAASAVASYKDDIEGVKNELTAIKGELVLVKWMLGVNLAISLALMWRVFR